MQTCSCYTRNCQNDLLKKKRKKRPLTTIHLSFDKKTTTTKYEKRIAVDFFFCILIFLLLKIFSTGPNLFTFFEVIFVFLNLFILYKFFPRF